MTNTRLINKNIFDFIGEYDDYNEAKRDLFKSINQYLEIEYGDAEGVHTLSKGMIEREAQFFLNCLKEFGDEVRIAPEPVLKRYNELIEEYFNKSSVREDFKLDEL